MVMQLPVQAQINALVNLDFDSDATELTSNFTEHGLTGSTTFSYQTAGGLGNSPRVYVAGNFDILRYNTPFSGISTTDTGYTVSTFFKAVSTINGLNGNYSIGTALLPNTNSVMGINTTGTAYLTAQVSALATPSGTPTQYVVNLRSWNGSSYIITSSSNVFTLTSGNWCKLTTTYKLTSSDTFSATITIDDYGADGSNSPVRIITYNSTPLSNSSILNADQLWVTLKTGAPVGCGTNSLDDFYVDPFPQPTWHPVNTLLNKNFDAVSTDLTSHFTEHGLTGSTTFSYQTAGGLDNSPHVYVAGNFDILRYNTPFAGFSTADTGYTISTFFKADSTTNGLNGNYSIGTALLPDANSVMGQNTTGTAYLTAQVSAQATPAGTPTQYVVNLRSWNGSSYIITSSSNVFTLTKGNWCKLTTTYKLTGSDTFSATITIDDFGADGTSSPTRVITYNSTSLSNSSILNADQLWVSLKTGAPVGCGTNALDDLTISLYPDPAIAERQFPSDAGFTDVTLPPYNAAGDGVTDDTAAIQQAINDHTGVIYLPNGTYKVSDRLVFKDTSGNWACFRMIQGQSRDKTIIKLADQCVGFMDANAPKAVLYTASQNTWNPETGSGDQAFMNSICNLTVDAGCGNAGAIGIDYLASNQGTIRDVLIHSSDPAGLGKFGLSTTRSVGPCLIKNLEIRGFDIGWNASGGTLNITAENITLSDQAIYGILNDNMELVIANLVSDNTVPAIHDQSGSIYGNPSVLVLNHAQLRGGASGNYAIESTGNIYLRDVFTSGYYVNAVRHKGVDLIGPYYADVAKPDAKYLSDAPVDTLNLPEEITPQLWDTDLSHWVSVGQPNGTDDTSSIQSAINNAPLGSTLYFPYGTYKVSDTITIGSHIRHVVGMMSTIRVASNHTFTSSSNPKPVFLIQTPSDSINATVLENLFVRMAGITGATAFVDASSKPLTLRNIMIYCYGGAYNNTGTGKLFLEDFAAHGQNGDRVICNNQLVWARQLNVEAGYSTTKPMVENNGSVMWILGFKTERTATFLATTNGMSQVLGAYHLVNSVDPGVPAYTCANSQVSLTFATNGNNPSLNPPQIFDNYLSRTGTGLQTLYLPRSETYGRYGSSSNYQREMMLVNSQ
tara:strand:- start:224 stop:3595 length:3372 start_codon:yes stop_codon:yes gene_type:complete